MKTLTLESDFFRKTHFVAAIIMLMGVLILSPATLFAQGEGMKRGNAGKGDHGYDVKSVETINGEVYKIDRVENKEKGMVGIHVGLKTASESIEVHLGPAWYVDAQSVRLAKGDAREIKGSKITYKDAPALIAATIKKGEEVLVLRDDEGKPVWRGKREN